MSDEIPPGYVPQAVLEERLKGQKTALTGEINALRARVAELEPLATSAAEIAKERDTLRSQIERVGRSDALRGVGLDPTLIDSVELLHGAAAAAADEPVDFASWLAADEGARAHPLLAPHFRPAAAADPAAPPVPVPPRLALPPENAQGVPAGATRMSEADLDRYLASPAFNSLPRDQQRAKLAELRRVG